MINTSAMPAVKNGGRKFRNDIILICSLLLVVAIIGLAVFFSGEEGASVTVTLNGKTYATYPLSIDQTVEIISGSDGQGVNILVIENGKAYVKEASCPDLICAAHRPISRSGESIACLPNRVVITVNGQDDNDIIS